MHRKIFALLLALLLGLGAFALAEEESAIDSLLPLEEGMFQLPILLTSVGQSADVNIVETLLKKLEIEARVAPLVEAAEVPNYKTLILAIGGSSKGLGAAGIDENQELARVRGLIKAAQESEVKILVLHIGGQARRGVLSDLFIPDAVNAAQAAIIVAAGDAYDGLEISALLAENETPAAYVGNQIEVLEPLKLVFTEAE